MRTKHNEVLRISTDSLNTQEDRPDEGLLGRMGRGTRESSEVSSSLSLSSSPLSSLSDGIMSWLTRASPDKSWKLKNLNLRRCSSKDIEEAMSGGISKAEIY